MDGLGGDSANQPTEYSTGQDATTSCERPTSQSAERSTTDEPCYNIIALGKIGCPLFVGKGLLPYAELS